MHLKNLSNQYVEAITQELYDKTPKAVFAAIAISLLSNGGDRLEEAQAGILCEWYALYNNGIIPQSIPTLKH